MKVQLNNLRCSCKNGTIWQRIKRLFGAGLSFGHIEVNVSRITIGQKITCQNCGTIIISIEESK
jgi:hypothetical protein